MAQSTADMLTKLEQVRQACLADSNQYLQVVPGIVPILQTAQAVEVRRWGSQFVAEAFATPSLSGHHKEQLISDGVMALLRGFLETPNEDTSVIQSAVQACASIYPCVFRKVISHPELVLVWRDMTTIKINILQRIDISPVPIRICCIKFLQKVVQVQTPGVIADPRRPEQNETSIALVPRNHPQLPLAQLEAETSGILDRLLSVIQENSIDPLLIDPTMNSLAVLLKTRPAVQARILQTVLNYNPLKAAGGPMTPKLTVIIKSLQRTTRALLRFVMRIMPQHPLAERVDLYLRRLQSSTTAVFAQAQAVKRPAEQMDDNTKRQKIDAVKRFPPMPPPPHSYAQLFTLVENPEFQQFDVSLLSEDIVSALSSALMQHIDSKSLDEAVEEVQLRLQRIQDMAKASAAASADEDDDYDPEALSGAEGPTAGALEQMGEPLLQPTLELGPFELPKPDPLTDMELAMLSEQSIAHVFETALIAEQNNGLVKAKLGVNRLAGSANDKDSWFTLMIRLATRAPAGLNTLAALNNEADQLQQPDTYQSLDSLTVPNRIRRQLFDYILDDWKHRLALGITWLTEEWYADKIQAVGMTNGTVATTKPNPATSHYDYWATRLLETLIPRFDKDDHRILIRFLSEIPAINRNILAQVKTLTRDPATVDICKKALQYLYLMRPPVRELVIDTMEDIYNEGDDEVKNTVGQLLQKWRPGFLDQTVEKTKREAEETRTIPNGVKAEEIGRPGSTQSPAEVT